MHRLGFEVIDMASIKDEAQRKKKMNVCALMRKLCMW